MGEELLAGWSEALRQDGGASSGWAALLEGHRLFVRGDLGASRRRLEAALESLHGDRVGRYLSLRALVATCYMAGDVPDGIAYGRQALEEAADDRERTESHVALANIYSVAGRWEELDEAFAALDAAGPVPAGTATRMAVLRGHRFYMSGDANAALAALEEALPDVERFGPREHRESAVRARQLLPLRRPPWQSDRVPQASSGRMHHVRAQAVEALTRLTEATLLAQQGRVEDCLGLLDDLLADPHAATNPVLKFDVHHLRGTALRRAGALERGISALRLASRLLKDADSPYDRVGEQLDLAFAEGLVGDREHAARRIGRLRREAVAGRLHFQVAMADLFLSVLALSTRGEAAPDLGAACAELVRLGHIDFLGQELVADREVVQRLSLAGLDDMTLQRVLEAVALQAGGPELLARSPATTTRSGLSFPSSCEESCPRDRQDVCSRPCDASLRTVRDRARRLDLGADAVAASLFPEPRRVRRRCWG